MIMTCNCECCRRNSQMSNAIMGLGVDQNIAVIDYKKQLTKEKQRREDAEKVIEFYAKDSSYSTGEFGMYLCEDDCFLDDYVDQASSTEFGGKKAKEYLKNQLDNK